jgi:hypothetical protein
MDSRDSSCRFRLCCLTALVATLTLSPLAAVAPPDQGLKPVAGAKPLIWDLGGQLALAAVASASGVDQKIVGNGFRDAARKAEALGVTLRPLPAVTGDSAADGAAAVNYVLNDAWKPIGRQLSTTYDDSHATLLEIALKSNLLLLLYSPNDGTGKTIAGVIERRAPDAGLPEGAWRPVVQAVNEGAAFDIVKARVGEMHTSVASHLRALK